MYEWRGRGVEVEVVLLHVLAVVALVAGQAEQALLQDRIAAVPQGEGEAEALVVVADAEQAVLAPAVRARARVVVGEVLPGGAVGAVVLAHRAPLPLRQIRAPAPPVGGPRLRLREPPFLAGHPGSRIGKHDPPARVDIRALGQAAGLVTEGEISGTAVRGRVHGLQVCCGGARRMTATAPAPTIVEGGASCAHGDDKAGS